MGFAGAPICITVGITTVAGGGILTASISAVFFL
jgi:hypothetical protein